MNRLGVDEGMKVMYLDKSLGILNNCVHAPDCARKAPASCRFLLRSRPHVQFHGDHTKTMILRHRRCRLALSQPRNTAASNESTTHDAAPISCRFV